MARRATSSRNKRPAAVATAGVRHVALIVESAVAPRRMMLSGVARYIQEHDPWAVYLKPFGVEKSLAAWLQGWKGDGIIAAVSDPDIALVAGRGIPIVDIMGALRHEGVPLVHTDDQAVGRLGAEHLMERGYRNLAFCGYPDAFWSSARRDGFREAVLANRQQFQEYQIEPLGPGRGGPAAWEQQQTDLAVWLSNLPKPAGIMATHDLLGQQVLEACLRLRINVPETIAVVAADNDEPICRIASPPLSSVIINDAQRGYEAAALLARMMAGEAAPEEPVYIQPAGVMARASTDIMAIDDAAIVKALRYLREHACDRISVEDIARMVPLSRSVLERRFRKLVGRSINNEIVRLRIQRAVALLTDTNLELKVIAAKAGFGSQSYMNAVFQEKVGKTPGSYRRQI